MTKAKVKQLTDGKAVRTPAELGVLPVTKLSTKLYGLYHIHVHWFIPKGTRAVWCTVTVNTNLQDVNRMKRESMGIAMCRAGDKFDPELGQRQSLARALKAFEIQVRELAWRKYLHCTGVIGEGAHDKEQG